MPRFNISTGMARSVCSLLSIFVIVSATATDAPFRFVSATPENVRLADGEALPESIKTIGWKWSPEQGNGGAFVSDDEPISPTEILMLSIDGLKPGAVYEVIGLFWADDAKAEGTPSQKHQPVQLGLTLATLHPFDGERPDEMVQREPWVVTPGYKTGAAFGYDVALLEDKPLNGLPNLNSTNQSSRLIRARLGYSRAGKDGSLPVFFSSLPTDWTSGQSIIDGLALCLADPDSPIELGWKAGTRLHHAIRAGDPITIRREIDAGADLNAFDEEGLTPLFHATASGDVALIHMLLKHGANPDQVGQSVSPLVAGAAHANPEATRLLLNAGAKVPLTSPHDKGALAIKIDPRFLHPAVASIRSGSLPVLKLLLEKQPTLDLESLFTDLEEIESERRNDPKIPDPYLVAYSINNHHWEMAAFLIDRGCQISSWGISGYDNPAATMMAGAVAAGNDAMPVIEAMLRRGIPPVINRSILSFPLDALNAAAWTGNAKLFRRFLPLARNASRDYLQCLLQYALYSENPEVIDLLNQQFPDLELPRGKPQPPDDSTERFEADSERLFLPRTTPSNRTNPSANSNDRVLAVISSPVAADAGDLLSITASGIDGWKVVDRALIESTLAEGTFSKPWLEGEHRLSDLGDRMTADCLIIVSAIKAGDSKVYRFEVVEVATGLGIHREHFKDSSFSDPREIAKLLERSANSMDAAEQNERHEAMTMLSFTSQGGIENPSTVSRILRATMQREIDSTPGLISLSRAQSSRLVEEQALSGKDSLWGASHLIEGVISDVDKNHIKVSLRLETLRDGVSTKTDAEAVGESSEIADTAARAWANLKTKSQTLGKAASQPSDLKANALPEGRRLIREAEWLHSSDVDPKVYLPLLESAIALGVPEDETVALHLDGMFCRFKFIKWRRSWLDDGRAVGKIENLPENFRRLPHPLADSDELLSQIADAREYLHLTSWYLDRFEASRHEHTPDHNDAFVKIWHSIQALSYLRSIVYRKQIPDESHADYQNFCAELDTLTRRYFSQLVGEFDPDPNRYSLLFSDAFLFKRNPELVNGLADMALTEAPLPSLLLTGYRGLLTIGNGIDNSLYAWMAPRKLLARRMIEKIGDTPSVYLNYKKADLECLVASTNDRPKAIHRLVDAQARVFAETGPYGGEMDYNLVSETILQRSTTSNLFYAFPMGTYLSNEGSMLPSLLLSPRPTPDLFIRHRSYQLGLNALRRQRYEEIEDHHPKLQAFKEQMKSANPTLLKSLENRRFRKRKSRGSSKIKAASSAKRTLSLIYGAAKEASPPLNPIENSSDFPPLQASLLADLRRGNDPGIAIWPLVDRANRDLLWIYYFPGKNQKIPVDLASNGAQSGNLNYKAPYLLCINCTDGSIVRAIDLHAAVGSAYGEDLSGRTCNIWDMAFDQTKSRIITNVGYSNKGYASQKMGVVIIDKDTGKAHPLPGAPIISEGSIHRHGGPWDFMVGVAGVGEHFFYFGRGSVSNGGAVKGSNSTSLSIFQVSPDLSISPFTVRGRRPELTPFDAIDRAPMALAPDQNRLWVANPSTIARYSPTAEKWTIAGGKAPPQQAKAFAEAKEEEFFQSLHEIHQDGKSTGWTAIASKHRAGVIPFTSATHGRHEIRLDAQMPDDFLRDTLVDQRLGQNNDRTSILREIPLKDHPRFKVADLIVFAQTESDLILGIQTGDYYEWKPPSRNAVHVPFLWKVSKKEILKRLAAQSQGKSGLNPR